MKYLITAFSILVKKLSLLERLIKKSLFILLLLGNVTSCKKEQATPTAPTIPIVNPPAEVGKVTVTTGTPIVIDNKTITFSGVVNIIAPAVVNNKFLLITWFNDTLHTAESETVFNLNYTKTNCIPGTKYIVKACAVGSTGVVYGDSTFATSTGFHIGQTYNGFKVWDVWSNSDSAKIIGHEQPAVSVAWGCQGTFIGGTSSNVNSGMANSLIIAAACPMSAAKLCLTDNALGTGAYLGSADEWYLCVQNKTKAGISFYNGGYWTSTESTALYALMVNGTNGLPNINAKMNGNFPVFGGPSIIPFKKVGK